MTPERSRAFSALSESDERAALRAEPGYSGANVAGLMYLEDQVLIARREIAEQASRESAWARKFEDQLEHHAIILHNQRRRLLRKWRADRKRLRAELTEVRASHAKLEQAMRDSAATLRMALLALGDGRWLRSEKVIKDALEGTQ